MILVTAAWKGFAPGNWQDSIDVRDFIQRNYTPYQGDGAFLAGPTARTLALREKMDSLFRQEHENGGVLKIDTETVITPTAFAPGYLDRENEVIVGFQTDEPLKRAGDDASRNTGITEKSASRPLVKDCIG